ncbi:MAG: malate synthase A [Deltaproteobacteria bacterium]|jgi:malate synthase|nr:malate synthase A [Deltaproteobacteria bacterium]MBT6433898.1 malate synthase A [Deltaproteobacteria bacterium]MBT6488971.1 malate synthase A [Deltaproteobacteria bacterium]
MGYTTETLPTPNGVELTGTIEEGYQHILSMDALEFIASLARTYTSRVEELLDQRRLRQARFDAGERPGFLEETKTIRERDWKVAKLPEDLLDRRVEITGPVDRKMIINALNSGASCFMADCEDSSAPTWANMVEGQINLHDAVRRTIDFHDPKKNKSYKLNDTIATLIVRPRGWHLWEKHLKVDGHAVPAGLFDFGLYFFHNAKALLERGTGPYFYLPKMESHLEARLWNDVFLYSQKFVGIPKGTIKATCLIETLPAAFEMDEILYELRCHSAGLNCGRWDYIFSYIKTIRNSDSCVVPDRGQVGMTQHFMRSYAQLAIQTCHKRGVHSMGGMAAQIPIKNDPEANEKALNKVKNDKLREVTDGHDGTWVAHPALVPLAKEIFDAHMKTANQIEKTLDDLKVEESDLLQHPEGTLTETGLRENISVGVQYIESWLRGVGCVPLYNLMEDAATAEISRAQLWQWIRHGAALEDGRTVTPELFRATLSEEMKKVSEEVGQERFTSGKYSQARALFEGLSTASHFEEFLTLPAYEQLITTQASN